MFANPQSRSILRFVSSWCISPIALASIRALIAVYIFASIFAKLGTESPFEAGLDFSYFTSLTFWGLAFYFAVASAHGFSYASARKRSDREVRSQDGFGGTMSEEHLPWLARWPKWLQSLHSFFYTTIVVFPFIVTSESDTGTLSEIEEVRANKLIYLMLSCLLGGSLPVFLDASRRLGKCHSTRVEQRLRLV